MLYTGETLAKVVPGHARLSAHRGNDWEIAVYSSLRPEVGPRAACILQGILLHPATKPSCAQQISLQSRRIECQIARREDHRQSGIRFPARLAPQRFHDRPEVA